MNIEYYWYCMIGLGISTLVTCFVLAACMLSSVITWEDKENDNHS
jgi:hypothetical protein